MTTILVILGLLFLIGIVIMIVHFIVRDSLTTALGSLLTILAGLVTALVGPEANGRANVDLSLGPLGHVTAQWIQVNSSKPASLWYLAFLTVGTLTIIAMFFVYDRATRSR